MEHSTTTLLEATNIVLENLGERRVPSIATPVSRKAVVALTQAVYDISALNDWSWLRDTIPAVSWTAEKADLGDVARVHAVQWGTSTQGYRNIEYVEPRLFDYRPLTSYNDTNSKPQFYTLSTYNIVRVNPYPADNELQLQIRFFVTRDMVPPTTATQTFPLPERHMSLLYYRAEQHLALSHLDDAEAAAQFGRQFELYANSIMQKERLAPTSGGNIFRRIGV